MTAPGDDAEAADASGDEESDARQTDPAVAFAALSDPLRVDILRELSAHRRETGGEVAGFADLRKRVGVRDSGRFRYHLNELRDHFVEKTGEGYRLTHAGLRVVAAILAGTYTDDVSKGPVDLDSECPFCGQSAVAAFRSGACLVTCGDDHPLFQWSVPPNAAADVALPEVVDLAELLAFQAIEQALAGVCPQCYDPVETAVVTDGQSRPVFRATCDTCGARVVGPVSFCLLVDPAVAAFCRRHGLTLDDDHVWEFPFVGDDSGGTVVDDGPVRVEFDVSLGEERLRATVDDRGEVVAVDTPDEP